MRLHQCAGGCGRTINRHLPFDALCWRRLPRRYRDAISGRDRSRFPTWTAGVIAAATWCRHHPIAARHRVTA